MVKFVRKLADGSYLFVKNDTYFKLDLEDAFVLEPILKEMVNEHLDVLKQEDRNVSK